MAVQFHIAQYLGDKSGAQCLTRMQRHNGTTPIQVSKVGMAAFPTQDSEALSFERTDYVRASHARKSGHTATD